MNSKFYKYCAVPQCGSTSIKTPEKLFIHVPRTENSRKKWLKLARRDSALVATQSKMYFCEDHFDLPNDMENYTEYHLMGSVSQIRMRAGCLPRHFGCQPDRKRRTHIMKTTRSLPAKRQRLEMIAECEREIAQAQSTQSFSMAEVQPGPNSDIPQPITTDKSIQVSIYPKCRSKSTQTQTKCKNIAVSPRKTQTTTVSTSPIKLEKSSIVGYSKTFKKLCFIKEELSDSDVSLFTPSLTHTTSTTSIISSQQTKASSENSSLNELVIKLEVEHIV